MMDSNSGKLSSKRRGNPYTNAVRRLEAAVEQCASQLAELELEKQQLQTKEEALVALVLQQESQLEHIGESQSRKRAALCALDMLLDRPPSLVAHTSPFASAHLSLDAASAAALEAETERIQQEQQQQQQAALFYSPFSQVTADILAAPDTLGVLYAQQPHANSSSSSGGGSGSGSSGLNVHEQPGWQLQDMFRPDISSSAETGGQYISTLMGQATPEQWECVRTWGKEDWGAYYCDVALRISLLLDKLHAASELADSAATPVSPATAATSATAAADSDSKDMVADIARAIINAGPPLPVPAASPVASAPAAPAAAAAQGLHPEATGLASLVVVAGGNADSWLADIEALVDDFACMTALGQLYNPYPLRSASIMDYSCHEVVVDIDPGHWTQMIEALQLTSRQVEQLTVAWQRYLSCMDQVVAKQQLIISAVNEASGAAALAEGGSGEVRPVTALELAGLEQVQKVLGRHLADWRTAAILLHFFFANTLTKLQIAHLITASYPYFPRLAPLAAVLCAPATAAAATSTSTPDDSSSGCRTTKVLNQQAKLLHERHMQQLRQRYTQLKEQHRSYWRQRQQLLQPLGLCGVLERCDTNDGVSSGGQLST